MAANIKLKRSAVSGKQPTDSDLQYGELAINYADGVLYYKTNSNEIASISGGGAFTDSSAPTGISYLRDGSLWWDAVNGKLKVRYDDGDPVGAANITVSATTNVNTTNASYAFDSFTDRATTHAADATNPNITLYVGDTLTIDNSTNFGVHPLFYVTQLDNITNGYNSSYNVVNPPSTYGGGTATVSYQFNAAGTYWYVCSAHQPMHAKITVLAQSTASAQWVDASPAGKGYTGSAGAIFTGEDAPASPADGQIWYNSSSGKSYIYYTNPSTTQQQWILLSDPTVTDGDVGYSGSAGYTGSRGTISPRLVSIPDPRGGDSQTVLYAPTGKTISQIRAVIEGTTSVAFNVVSGTSRGTVTTTHATINTSNNTAGDIMTISNATVPFNSWMWIEVTGAIGTPTELAVNIVFDE